MNSATRLTLVAIVIVIGGMVASFIWFVMTWDKEAEQPIVRAHPPLPLLLGEKYSGGPGGLAPRPLQQDPHPS